ncbi:MAG: MFS transporter, partial [Planctomycetaceae bacterium]
MTDPVSESAAEARGDGGGGRPPSSGRRLFFAWGMYDWANSAYSTLSITVLVSYLKEGVLPGDAGTIAWTYGIGGTMFLAALLSPICGAIADAHASKHRWLAGTALTGAAASMLMFFATPDRAWLLVALFLLASLAFELSLGFYNGFLPDIADEKSMGRVSAWGFAFGYLGGGLALALVVALFIFGDALGLPAADHFRERLGLLIMGVWWGGFSLPTLLVLRDRRAPKRERQSLHRAVRQALGEVAHTLRNVRTYR